MTRLSDPRSSLRRAPLVLGAAVLVFGLIFAGRLLGEDSGSDDPVVAMVGDVAITQSELEASVQDELMDLERQRHRVLEQALEDLIDRKVLELEAAKAGEPQETWVGQQLRVSPTTDAEVDAFYEAQKGRITQPKEAIAEQIRQYLDNQKRQKAYEDLVAERKKAYKVRRVLEPLRVEVATEGSPAEGPEAAPVTIVEFSDFQCPYCARLMPTLKQVRESYGDKVRIVYRQFPLTSIHPFALKAAEASLCADAQGKFWEFHDRMFANQRQLAVENLRQIASELGLDTETFNSCLDSGQFNRQVAEDVSAGQGLGVNSTPSMFINGRFLSGAVPYDQIAVIIDDELARREQDGD